MQVTLDRLGQELPTKRPQKAELETATVMPPRGQEHPLILVLTHVLLLSCASMSTDHLPVRKSGMPLHFAT